MVQTPKPPAETLGAVEQTNKLPNSLPQSTVQTQPPKARTSRQQTEYGFDLRGFIDEVMSRLSVEAIYSHPSHDFKVSGNRHRGGCPFHESRSGSSFVVSHDSLLCWCEGCHHGASAIDYLYSLSIGRWDKPRGWDFIKTVKQLAELAGMSLPDLELSPEQIEVARKWEARRDILQVVAEYGQEVLWSSRGITARQYLIEERGLTEDAIRDLGLGLYLSRAEVQQVLSDKGYNLEDAKDAGVIWSKLEGYILFPWLDSRGRPLTIYGRYCTKTPPQEKPKTIALPGSGTKASPLYFDRTVKAGHKDLVLVEGVLDAALLQSVGDTRVCAYVAGSCSEAQIETMKRHGIKSVTLCGDPDCGGDNGTNSNIDRITRAGIRVYVAPKLPDGLDPDEFLLREGVEGWNRHIEGAVHAYSWKAKYLIKKFGEGKELSDKTKATILQQAIAFSKTIKGVENTVDLKAFFWPTICAELGISIDEFYRDTDTSGSGGGNGGDGAGGEDGDGDEYSSDEDDGWNPPVSWNGQIGWLVPVKQEKVETDPNTGETSRVLDNDGNFVKETVLKFVAKCNFDFVIERELCSEDGGGVVLQLKRMFDGSEHQKRLVIKSVDYTEKSRFIDAIKLALGAGVVCNLKIDHLGALMHSRLKEYRDNGGKIYRLADRIGQQEDGTWVFSDRQFTKDGNPTTEEETLWVANPDLGKEDFIPTPQLAPEDPGALKRLVDAARRFFGQGNIFQCLLTMGWVLAGLHSQEIFKRDGSFALFNSYGEPGSCKTFTAETALSLVGSNWPQAGMIAKTSISALYEHGSKTGSLPFFWDDPERTPQNEELLKTWYNRKPRMVRGNKQTPHSPLGVTSNHVVGGDQAATFTRFIRNHHERKGGGDKLAFQELKEAQALASGAFPSLLKVGYPRTEVIALENELLTYLPQAHARIAQSLAITVFYAQKIVELASGTEDIKAWAISQLCRAEDDADSVGDSLQDFVEKIISLESQSLTGDWNKRLVTRGEQIFVAIHYSDVWSLVDKHFKPATYNLKALKPLVLKAGGVVDNCVQKFDISRDETLAYYRNLLSPRTDKDGMAIDPNPPRKTGRKSWLLPVELFGDERGDGGDDNSPPSPDPSTPTGGIDSSPDSSPVTRSYQKLPENGNRQDVDVESVSAVVTSQVTKLPTKEEDLEKSLECLGEKNEQGAENNNLDANCEKAVTLVTTVKSEPTNQTQSQSQPVTNFGNSSVTSGNSNSEPCQKQASVTLTSSTSLPTQVVTLQVGDYVVDKAETVVQITGLAQGGWMTRTGDYISRDDIRQGLYTKVESSLEVSVEQSDTGVDDEWNTVENVEAMAEWLDLCEDAAMLADVRAACPHPEVLRSACRLLEPAKVEQIAKWVAELNSRGGAA